MLDIINPWRALRRANAYIAELEEEIAHWEIDSEEDYLVYRDAAQRLERAEALIAQGHFRNPETGRIGPKGKTFQ
jgi:hypothetical protein